MKLPITRIEDGRVAPAKPKRAPGPKPTAQDRAEMLRIWGGLSSIGHQLLLAAAREIAANEKLQSPEVDGPLIRTGKR